MFNDFPEGDAYETVGSQVFNQWDTINAELPPSHSAQAGNPMGRLYKIVTSPVQNLPVGWEEELSEITSSMTAVDYALHGKKIAEFFLRVLAYDESAPQHRFSTQRSSPTKRPGVPFGPPKRRLDRPFPQWLPTNRDSDV
jgi:hypothetical protein